MTRNCLYCAFLLYPFFFFFFNLIPPNSPVLLSAENEHSILKFSLEAKFNPGRKVLRRIKQMSYQQSLNHTYWTMTFYSNFSSLIYACALHDNARLNYSDLNINRSLNDMSIIWFYTCPPCMATEGTTRRQHMSKFTWVNFLLPPIFYCAYICFYCFLQCQEMLEISYFLQVISSSFRADLRKSNPMLYIQHSGICSIENKITIFKKKQDHILFARWQIASIHQ